VMVAVDVAGDPVSVALAEPEDCRRFHIQVTGEGTLETVAEAIDRSGAGHLDGDHAYIAIDWIRSRAEGRVPSDWPANFDAMIGFARSKGWLDEDGGAIQAHIEWA
jgi:hypothetical protein